MQKKVTDQGGYPY